MIWPFSKQNKIPDGVYAAYSGIVAQSRQERFFAEWGVPDTVAGRFDMISLHLSLVFRHLRADEAERDQAQAIFDLFFKDMDRSLREMGIGDVGVPKKIEKMGSVFYGLLKKVNTALDDKDTAELVNIMQRNVFVDSADEQAAATNSAKLAAYLITQDEIVSKLSNEAKISGSFFAGIAA